MVEAREIGADFHAKAAPALLTLGDGTTVHFRASGNAPELRVYVEASDQAGEKFLLLEGLDFARHLVG